MRMLSCLKHFTLPLSRLPSGGARRTEIAETDVEGLGEKHILAFEISVDNIVLMQNLEADCQ